MTGLNDLKFHPLTPDCWTDFERLFGPRGACGGCWCMYWKLSHKEFIENPSEKKRQAQKAIVTSGRTPGLLAYMDGIPAGWMAIEPRSNYPTLARSRILKPVDEKQVWSVTCFFIDKRYRRQGLTIALLRASLDYVRSQGGKVVEGYPTEPRQGLMPATFVYTGLASAFRQAGFVEVARRSPTRPIMRFLID